MKVNIYSIFSLFISVYIALFITVFDKYPIYTEEGKQKIQKDMIQFYKDTQKECKSRHQSDNLRYKCSKIELYTAQHTKEPTHTIGYDQMYTLLTQYGDYKYKEQGIYGFISDYTEADVLGKVKIFTFVLFGFLIFFYTLFVGVRFLTQKLQKHKK